MAFSVEELEDMRGLLQRAYNCAAANFRCYDGWADTQTAKRDAAAALSTAATALLLADERLEATQQHSNIAPAGAKLPGKP